jgi:hypothetical protein
MVMVYSGGMKNQSQVKTAAQETSTPAHWPPMAEASRTGTRKNRGMLG